MIQRITCASNEDIMKIKEMLIRRARKYKRELCSELPFIIYLKKALEQHCKGKNNSIKMVMIKEFANDLQIVIDTYSNIPPKKVYKKLRRYTETKK